MILHDLVADPDHRIERRHRFLEDHRDAPPAQCPPLCCRQFQQIAPLEANGPCDRSNVVGQQAHHSGGADRLAGAGFTDNAKDLPRVQRERDRLDGEGSIGVGGQRQRQLLDRQNRVRRRLAHGV